MAVGVLCALALLSCSPHGNEGTHMPNASRYEPWPGYWAGREVLLSSLSEKGASTFAISEIESVLTDWEKYGLLQYCWENIRERVSMRDVILVYESGGPNEPYYSCRAIIETGSGIALITSPMVEDTTHKPDIRCSVVTGNQSQVILSLLERDMLSIESDLSPDERMDDPNIYLLTVSLKGRDNSAVFIEPEQSESRETRQLVFLIDSIFSQ
jgi:hypothetical protein